MPQSSLIYSTVLLFFLWSCSDDGESKKKTETKENWYTVSSLDDQTWVFEERSSPQVNVSYLIAGSERAIMFDAGTGENAGYEGTRIMYKIQEVTDLPVTLLLSHFHFDHNQNVAEFERVAFPAIDFLQNAVDQESVYHFSQQDLFEGSLPASVKVDEWFPLETAIDLGGRSIELVNLPGHTDESVVIIDHVGKKVFLGDLLYNGPMYIFDDQDIAAYISSLTKLSTLIDDTYTLFGAHDTPKVSYQSLLRAKDFLECISSGDDCYRVRIENVFGRPAKYYQSLTTNDAVLLFLSD